MAKETQKYTDKSIHITPFGVDMNLFKPDPNVRKDKDKTVGIVKSLSDKYGISDLIRAFAIVYQECPNVKFLIVGDGPQKTEYELLAKQLGINEVIAFCWQSGQ